MREYKVGYLPATFDLFHIGHVNAILKAKSYCDDLIVGLLSDKAVKGYKGVAPIIFYEEREVILELIKIPFIIVKQDSINPYDNLMKHNVDVVFSGDGWEENELQAINKAGCELVEFDYFSYQSTTKIKNKILKMYGKK